MKRNHLVLAVFLSISVIQPIISIAQENPDRGKEEPLVLEEVKVKAPTYAVTPADFPGTVNVITQEEIDRAQPQHVGDLLKSVPGIHYQDEDGRGFRPNIGIRGLVPFRSRQVLFLVDGIPIQPSVYGDPATYYNVPVQRVERVEIIKGGPSAVLYGPNTIGGVINYITKRPSERPLDLFVRESGGSYDEFSSEVSVSGTRERLRYYVSNLRKQGNGFRQNDQFSVNDGTVRLEGDFGLGNSLVFNFNYYDERSGTPGGLTASQFRQNPKQSQTPNDVFEGLRFSGDLTYKHDLGAYGSLQATTFGNFFERNWFIAGTSTTRNDQFRRKFDVFGLEPRYSLNYNLFGLKNQLISGFRLYLDRETDRQVRGSSPTARTGTTLANNELQTVATAFYLLNEFSLTDRLKITPAIRYESIRLSRENFQNGTSGEAISGEPIPAFGVSYRLLDDTYLFGSFQRSFKPPEFREAISPTTGANLDLKAQDGLHYELGLRSRPLDWLSIETSVFLFDFKNQIISQAGVLSNAQDTRHKGLEGSVSAGLSRLLSGPLGVALPLWAGDLSVQYSLTLLDATFSSGQFKGNLLPNAPKHTSFWSIRYTHPTGIFASLNGLSVGRQFTDSANTAVENAAGTIGRIPSYTVWDLNLEYKLPTFFNVKNPSLFFNTKNLFDKTYFTSRSSQMAGIVPAPDRLFRGGLSFNY